MLRGNGCAGGGVPLGAMAALSWWEEVSLGGKQILLVTGVIRSLSLCEAHEHA